MYTGQLATLMYIIILVIAAHMFCFKKITCENSIPQIDSIRNCEAFGNLLALGKGPAFQNEISTFLKRCDRAFLHLPMWHYIRKTAICEEGSQPLLSTEAPGVLVSDFSALSVVRSRFMLWCSMQPERTRTASQTSWRKKLEIQGDILMDHRWFLWTRLYGKSNHSI